VFTHKVLLRPLALSTRTKPLSIIFFQFPPYGIHRFFDASRDPAASRPDVAPATKDARKLSRIARILGSDTHPYQVRLFFNKQNRDPDAFEGKQFVYEMFRLVFFGSRFREIRFFYEGNAGFPSRE
jgi:hypothetical protein